MKKEHTILIVEDDPALTAMLRFMLERNSFKVMQAVDSTEADECLKTKLPDVVLLDWMLPGLSGVEYAQKLKQHPTTVNIPVILVTAKGEEEDMVVGLDSGADDYVTKPFSQRTLMARIRASLRRSKPHQQGEVLHYHGVEINPQAHSLLIDGQAFDIGNKELQLLYTFMSRPQRVYDRDQLLDKVWGRDAYLDSRTVDVYIRRLRKSLGAADRENMIETVRGVGYRLNTSHVASQ